MRIPFKETPHYEEMVERITFAFEDSVVKKKLLELLSLGSEEVQGALKQLIQERSIDTAEGKQLDIIGDIVGQQRELVNVDTLPFFGYIGAPLAKGYGDEDDPSVGGYYWDGVSPRAGNVVLSDSQYRVFIKAKILKNRTRATPEDVMSFIKFVFDVETVSISSDGGGHALVIVIGELDQFEKSLLNYYVEEEGYRSYFVPKTLGVKYQFGGTNKENYFAFLGAPNAKGYGTVASSRYDGEYNHDGTTDYDILDKPERGGHYVGLYTEG